MMLDTISPYMDQRVDSVEFILQMPALSLLPLLFIDHVGSLSLQLDEPVPQSLILIPQVFQVLLCVSLSLCLHVRFPS